ncbi:uncharacterized protein TM35_000011600 [Trypanosoma theileri]|uniref:Uncharacterized protein n=1 Tax=Trypanosoma theileri TaxID=67003 RepID=A0A1X0P9G9_9TRYP|nr:uncharacterized protein TM35_000011600 [Trypanosoma theileri]ORC93283.1 hypothetical protein TM35_000011600 [Trypanosoma theileri]
MTVKEPPPLSLLLPGYGTVAKSSLVTFSTSTQWLWYFYLTVWPRPFLSQMRMIQITSEDKNKEKCNSTTFSFEDVLKSVEFPTADDIAMYETQWRLCPAEIVEEIKVQASKALEDNDDNFSYPLLPRVSECWFGRLLRALAVKDYLSVIEPNMESSTSPSPSSLHLDNLLRKSLEAVRRKRQQQQQQQHQRRKHGGENVEMSEIQETELEVLKNALREMLSSDTVTERFPLLFDVVSLITGVNDDEVILEVYRARLFSALTIEIFGRVKTASARLLLAYINGNSSGDSISSEVAISARACGVVIGVIEYAIAYRCSREDGTGRCPLTAAALLLHNLVELQDEAMKKDNIILSSSLLATIVVSCIQELICSMVTGGGTGTTTTTPHQRPPSSTGDASNVEGKKKIIEENSVCNPITTRALTLQEVDAVLRVFFPAFLQQMGFEWPWSESLRQARQLDKVQQKTISIQDGVRINSNAVFEEIFFALSHRTYAARLRCILPQSCDRLLDAVFPTDDDDDGERRTRNGDGDHEDNKGKPPQFVMPAYYRAAGEVMLEFFKRSGINGTTSAETERVLQRSIDILPMIVQLQALGTHLDNNTMEEGEDDDNDHHSHHHQQQQRHASQENNLLRTVRLSEEEKHRLLMRYRCEVLLASIIVYTQLQTVSLVQQLIRQLAPLIEKLLLPLLQGRTLRRSAVMIRTKRNRSEHENMTEESVIEFTPEFKVLVDKIHYQFYPLEWIPEVIDTQLRRRATGEDIPPHTYYSVFAAVAHQFGLILQGSPQGVRGGDGSSNTVRVKAYRFFTVLLVNSIGDAVTSSCEFEGAIAVAATRRVGGNRQQRDVDSAQLQQRGAPSFHTVVNSHDVVLTLAQCLLPVELTSLPDQTVGLEMTENEEQREFGCEGWIRRIVEWTQSKSARWTMQGATVRETVNTSIISLQNSFTFDAVPLSREVIRVARRRLIEKMHVTEEYGNTSSANLLLQQQLLSLQSLLESIELLPQELSQKERVITAAMLLWSSPFFSHELQRLWSL